jgi:prevent-host-death family protein
MDVYYHQSRDAELDGLLDRVAAGESVEIVRDGRPVAVLVPAGPSPASFDWDALKTLTDGMAFDQQSTVVEMRRNARY